MSSRRNNIHDVPDGYVFLHLSAISAKCQPPEVPHGGGTAAEKERLQAMFIQNAAGAIPQSMDVVAESSVTAAPTSGGA